MLKLTEVFWEDGKRFERPIWIAIDRIVFMRAPDRPSTDPFKATGICLGAPHWVFVSETPEEIVCAL